MQTRYMIEPNKSRQFPQQRDNTSQIHTVGNRPEPERSQIEQLSHLLVLLYQVLESMSSKYAGNSLMIVRRYNDERYELYHRIPSSRGWLVLISIEIMSAFSLPTPCAPAVAFHAPLLLLPPTPYLGASRSLRDQIQIQHSAADEK